MIGNKGPILHSEVLDTLLHQINTIEASLAAAKHDDTVDQKSLREERRKADALLLAYRALGGETEPREITDDTMITGAEWRDFYKNNWPKEFYIDDVGIDFEDENGNYILPDEGLYRLGDFGSVGYHGPSCDQYKNNHLYPLAPFYARFRREEESRAVVSFKIDRNKTEGLKAAAARLGGVPIN
jgi:hypothetical protein